MDPEPRATHCLACARAFIGRARPCPTFDRALHFVGWLHTSCGVRRDDPYLKGRAYELPIITQFRLWRFIMQRPVIRPGPAYDAILLAHAPNLTLTPWQRQILAWWAKHQQHPPAYLDEIEREHSVLVEGFWAWRARNDITQPRMPAATELIPEPEVHLIAEEARHHA